MNKQWPEVIYRFFLEEWQAGAFLDGNIWISTLTKCREYEDNERGDKEEGYEKTHSGTLYGSSEDTVFVEKAANMGIEIGPGCSNCTIKNSTKVIAIQDAYILCTSLSASISRNFGKYGVEITNPEEFFRRVSQTLSLQGLCGAVDYTTQRDRNVGEKLQKHPAFIKPLQYKAQQEFRFLWYPQSMDGLMPLSLNCPDVKALCVKIN